MVQKQKGAQQGRSDFPHPPFHCSTFGHVGVKTFFLRGTLSKFKYCQGNLNFSSFNGSTQNNRLRRKS
jgi:hypothetical protein